VLAREAELVLSQARMRGEQRVAEDARAVALLTSALQVCLNARFCPCRRADECMRPRKGDCPQWQHGATLRALPFAQSSDPVRVTMGRARRRVVLLHRRRPDGSP
jgi:hypothetical protein